LLIYCFGHKQTFLSWCPGWVP